MNYPACLTPRIAAACKPLAIFIAVLALGSFGGCKKAAPQDSAINEQAAKIAAASAPEARDVQFGKKFALLGVVAKPTNAGVAFEFAWKSLAKQRLESLVPVHLTDAGGKILAQADYRQRPEHGEVGEGAIWIDAVSIPHPAFQGATTLGISIVEPNGKSLPADRGPRDWGGNRLLVPLPPDLPSKPVAFQGSLDLADCNRFTGWAADKDHPNMIVEVEIFDGEKSVARIAADAPRPDLITGGFGDGRHGFNIATPAQFKDGRQHTFSVRIADTRFELRNSPAAITCPKK